MRDSPDATDLPRLWCDFNACGWSGEPGDDCFYAFDTVGLEDFAPQAGLRVFAYDYTGNGSEVFGCEAILERFGEGWRLRPASSWRNA
jgi:hypothetical protein